MPVPVSVPVSVPESDAASTPLLASAERPPREGVSGVSSSPHAANAVTMTTKMKTRDIILGSYWALSILSCVGNKSNADDAGASAANPAPTNAAAPAVEAGPAAKPAPLAPSAVTYDDKNDLPANAGDARCADPIPANAKPASVKVELTSNPPGIELTIASLGIQQKLWTNPTPPKQCHAALEGGAVRFRCSDDTSAVDAKLYSRKSDVVIGRATSIGTGTTKFVLPCGTAAKFEPIVCPKDCKKEGDGCTCVAK